MERVSTNFMSHSSLASLMQARGQLTSQYEKITSGKEVNVASDDPVLAARILDTQRSISNIEQADRYAIAAIADLEGEETVLKSIDKLALKARSSMVQGSSGTISAEGMAIVAEDINQVLEQIALLSNSKNLDGAYIFSGYSSDAPAYSFTRDASGNIISATYNGDNFTVEKTISPSLKIGTSHPGPQVFDDGTISIFDELVKARDELLAGNPPTGLADYDVSMDKITAAMTDVGTRVNHVEFAQQVNSSLKYSQEISLGRIRDLDLPKAIMEFSQIETATEAINTVFAKVSKVTLFDYIR